jgi:hypothetical protein
VNELIISGGSEEDYAMLVDIILDLQDEGLMEDMKVRVRQTEVAH